MTSGDGRVDKSPHRFVKLALALFNGFGHCLLSPIKRWWRRAGVPAMNDKPIAVMTIEEARDELRLWLRVDMETPIDLGTASSQAAFL